MEHHIINKGDFFAFLDEEQPFWTLSYADDPLSWGDEEQSKALYEEAFDFYRKQHNFQLPRG